MSNKKVRRLNLFLTPALVLLTLATLWFQIIKPSVVDFMRRQVPQINHMQSMAHITVGDIDLSLLKLQLSAFDVRAEFSPDLNLRPASASSVSVQLDIFDLIIGHISLARVTVTGLDWDYDVLPSQNSELPQIPVDQVFSALDTVPVHRVIIHDSNITLHLKEAQSDIHLDIPLLTLTNRKNEAELGLKKLSVEFSQLHQSPVKGSADLEARLTRSGLAINKMQFQILDSSVNASASFEDVKNLLRSPHGQLNVKSQVNLQDVRSLTLLLSPQEKRVPAMTGSIETGGQITLKGLKNINGTFELRSGDLVMDHMNLGRLSTKATLKQNLLQTDSIELVHPSGSIKIRDASIDLKSPYRFSAQADMRNVDLQKLFVSLGLRNIPAGFIANGNAACTGSVQPELSADCQIDTALEGLWVKPALKDNLHILKLKAAHIKGVASVTLNELEYRANIAIGSSQGTSQGTVNFKNGFNISFETASLDFKNVESLADLDIKGDLKISGTAQGDTSRGIINASIDMKDTEVAGFRLGRITSDLGYKDTQLSFKKLSGEIGKSTIRGDLTFFFNNSTLAADFQSDNITGQDLLFILNQNFSLPFELTGAGNVQARIRGPFNFWKLTYDLKANLKNGSLAGERFENLYADLQADGQRISFRDVYLKKARSSLKAEGVIDTSETRPQFNLTLSASPLLLEESDHIILYAPSITGIGYAEGKVSGFINEPEVSANFTLQQVSYDKVDYPNSQGSVHINKSHLRFNGQFFGRQIQSDIIWPWNEKDSFSAKVLIQDLNPLFLLPLASLPQPGTDFTARLNADIDLSGKRRELTAMDGYIKITEFLLKRGTQSLSLEKPVSMIFRSGLKSMENLSLKGDGTHLLISMNQASNNSVRLDIEADLQLRMFHFLVPFAQSLSGNLQLDSQILLRNGAFELFGEGELVDGLVSMKGFPQSIENVNTPIEFSKSRILLSDITGQLGQSDITGFGQIDILGSKNIAVNLRAVADNVEITFPDQIFTAGRANINFTGNWLPYTLKVDYIVSHGLVEKNFEQDTSKATTLQASSFLPPQQAEQLTPSLALDVNIDASRGIFIRNSLLEGEAFGKLKIKGSPEAPVLIGKIDIRPGSKIFFKDKPFDIQTATIQFQESREINPDIYISANSRISDYDINLLVQGTAKNLVIKPTSQPPLSESDLFSLIALGVTSQNDQNLSSDTQQKQTGLEVLAAISNQSQLNRRIQEKLGLTVQLAPSVDSTKNIAVPKVVVSKKISDKLNASYSKPFTGNDQNQEIKLQYLYNKNVSFLLNYQNKDTVQQEQITNSPNSSKGILGLDLEYREEFK